MHLTNACNNMIKLILVSALIFGRYVSGFWRFDDSVPDYEDSDWSKLKEGSNGNKDTCKDIHLGRSSYGQTSQDGLYHFKPRDADPCLIYCDFEVGYGYTFISTTAHQYTHPGDHSYDRSGFKIVLLYSNGSQYQAAISRPKKSRKIDVLYTYESSYNSWLSNDLMYPYITVSMKSRRKNMTTRGYIVNGAKVPDGICDVVSNKKNVNLIFAFLFNHNNTDPVQDEKRRNCSDFLKKWVDLATLVPEDKKLARNFFSFFEIHHKNCGGYMTSEDFTDIVGAAVGLKYVIECGTPPEYLHATKHISGYVYKSVVTYTCDEGYEFLENLTTLTCSANGEWHGQVSICLQRKPRTCIDHVTMFHARVSGVYIVFDRYNNEQPYDVYCDFYDNYTLTFLTSNSMHPNNFKYHYNDNTVVVVRSYVSGGRQVDSEIRHLTTGQHIDISYEKYKQYNKLSVAVKNQMRYYRYISDAIGYKVNDVEVKTSEDRYRYGYDRNNAKTSIGFQTGFKKPTQSNYQDNLHWFLEKWYYEAKTVPGDRYMPKHIFFSFEMTSDISGEKEKGFADIYGINIGVRHNRV